MPSVKKSKKSPLQQKCPVGLLKKHKRVRQSEKVIKEGKHIRVDDEGVEDFDDYFTKSDIATDPRATSIKSTELNKNIWKTSHPCKHYSKIFPLNSDDSYISRSFVNEKSITKDTKQNSSDDKIAEKIGNERNLSVSVSPLNLNETNGVKHSNGVSEITALVLAKNKTTINKKHKRKRKDEEQIKQGKIIRTDEDGIEEFDDYFTKSTIIANSNDSREIFNRSKLPKNICDSRKTDIKNGTLIKLKNAEVESSMHNGISSIKNQKNGKTPSTNLEINHTLNKTSSGKNLASTKKSPIEQSVSSDKKKANESPPTMNKKTSRKRKTELKITEATNQKTARCLTESISSSPIAKLNSVVVVSKGINKNCLFEPTISAKSVNLPNVIPNKSTTSPCSVTVVDLSCNQSFVDRVESCKVDLFTNCSPGKAKKGNPISHCKEKRTLVPESKKQNLKRNAEKTEYEDSVDKNRDTEKVKHDELVNVLKHCSNVKLEIENLSPEKISKISNSEKITSTSPKKPINSASDKRKVARILLLNESYTQSKNDIDFSMPTEETNQASETKSHSNSNEALCIESKKLKIAKGGKHFLPKRNFARERRSSSVGQKYCSVESDSDDASESDGHIYLPSKPSKPQIKKVSTGDLEDLAIPSTSRWKPKIKKSKKVKLSKGDTPEIRKKLSTITESNEKTANANLANSPRFQPKVLLSNLEIQSSTINNYDSVELNKQQLTSALKGTRKKKLTLNVSFKEPDFILSNDIVKVNFGENFLPLYTPPIHTPNVRRSRRKKIPRLNYGLNQKVIYQRRPSGGFVAVGIDLGCSPERPDHYRPYQRQKMNKKLDTQSPNSSSSIRHPSVIDQGLNTSLPKVINPITHQEVTYEQYSKRKALTWFGPTSLQAEAQDPFITAKPLQDSLGFFGFLKLRGYCEKPFSQRPNDALTFIITKGRVLVEINNFQMVMEKEDAFVIPKANPYKLTNLRNDEATLIFITK